MEGTKEGLLKRKRRFSRVGKEKKGSRGKGERVAKKGILRCKCRKDLRECKNQGGTDGSEEQGNKDSGFAKIFKRKRERNKDDKNSKV